MNDKEPSSSVDSNHTNTSTLNDTTMDATASVDAAGSEGEKQAASPAGKKRARPTKKRKSLHLDVPSGARSAKKGAKKAQTGSSDDEDHQTHQKQPKRKKRGLLKQPSKQVKKKAKIAQDSDDDQKTKVKRRSQAKGRKKASGAKNKESSKKYDSKEESAAKSPKTITSDVVAAATNNNNKEGIWPQINDVLMGNLSPSAFDHVGNRRFRVLVEASLANYFSDISTQELLAVDDTAEPTKKQCQVVEAVIASVEGNVPAGRFLVHNPDGSDNNGKLATRIEIKAKVHSTFLAAGRFHVKKHVAALMVLDASSSEQIGSVAMSRQVGLEEQGATAGAMQSEEQQIELEDAVKAVQAAATVVEMDVKPTAAAAATAATSDTLSNETSTSNSEHAAYYSNAMITNALSKYHAKNRQVVAEQTAAAALKEMFLAVSVRKGEEEKEDVEKPPLAAQAAAAAEAMQVNKEVTSASSPSNNNTSEIDYLAKESMRIRAILSRGKKGERKMHGGGVAVADGGQRKQHSCHFANIVSSYLPSRSTRKASIAAGGMTAATMSSLPLPSSIDELFSISSSSAASATSRSLSSSRAISEGSISPPQHRPVPTPAVVAPQVPAVAAAVLPEKEVEKQEEATVPVDTPSLLDGPVSLQCPARIKVFLALPVDRFFVDEEENSMAYSHSAHVPPTVSPSSYIMPSNYDILCGSGQSFFHHVGNRRFRIMIEMNVHRYEKAYMASLSNNASSVASLSNNTGEDSIQKLINETVITLSLCDPPGRFLGMEMTTGRWRVLNPIFAQLKTEQTFFECFQVRQRRKVRQLEEEWKERMHREKEILLEELEGRVTASVESVRRSTVTTAPVVVDHQPTSRRVTQGSLPENSGGAAAGVCPARNFCPLLVEEDLSTLQKQAKASLRRRQTSSCFSSQVSGTQATTTYASQAACPTILHMTTPDVEELNSIAMSEIVQRFAQEQLHHRLQQERMMSLPIQLSMPSSSLPSQQGDSNDSGGSSSPVSSVMSRQESNCSCESSDHSSTAIVVVQPTQHHHQQQAASSPIDDNGHHQVKDLLDVVGGMMMMSQRSPC